MEDKMMIENENYFGLDICVCRCLLTNENAIVGKYNRIQLFSVCEKFDVDDCHSQLFVIYMRWLAHIPFYYFMTRFKPIYM